MTHDLTHAPPVEMRTRFQLLSFALLLAGCRSAPPPGAAPTRTDRLDPALVLTVVHEADRRAGAVAWPGFDAARIPSAIFDGERTWLVGHPAPPAGFASDGGAASFAGRHPAVVANSSAEIGGVPTATVILTDGGASVPRAAGLLVHEKFHVFQRDAHPAWVANEAELFTYPVDDADGLALRRMETEMLRRALQADAADRRTVACWARAAVATRRARLAALPAGAAGYERGTELNEGLATYVERRALELPDSTLLPREEYPADEVRQRAYGTGAALALLLDRLSPGWKSTLQRSDSIPLDSLLALALGADEADGPACALAADELEPVRARAESDVEALRVARAERRRAFLDRPGWTLVVSAPGPPLFPRGFDPLNVHPLGGGEVLHARFLALGDASSEVEVMGRASLSAAAGAHPLFEGVRTLTITGLDGEPTVRDSAGTLLVRAEGVTARLHGAAVERTGRTVTVRLSPSGRGPRRR